MCRCGSQTDDQAHQTYKLIANKIQEQGAASLKIQTKQCEQKLGTLAVAGASTNTLTW
jgi:hypothetical protein